MTTKRDELLAELTKIQNRNTSQDIMSFAGFCKTDEEMAEYVASQKENEERWAKRQAAEKAKRKTDGAAKRAETMRKKREAA